MNPIRIEDIGDPRIAAYRDIRERDLVGRQGLFVAEGKVVLSALLASPAYRLQSVFVLENRLAGLEEVLSRAPAGLPVYVASSGVMDAIAGFPIHRGILAIAERPTEQEPSALLAGLPERSLVLTGLRGVGKTVLLNTLRSAAVRAVPRCDSLAMRSRIRCDSALRSASSCTGTPGYSGDIRVSQGVGRVQAVD